MGNYLNITPEKGQWYISERYRSNKYPATIEIDAKVKARNRGASNMILAGPFPSEDAAKLELRKIKDKLGPFVWQAP